MLARAFNVALSVVLVLMGIINFALFLFESKIAILIVTHALCADRLNVACPPWYSAYLEFKIIAYILFWLCVIVSIIGIIVQLFLERNGYLIIS